MGPPRHLLLTLALALMACGDDARASELDASQDMATSDMPPRTDSGPRPDLGGDAGSDAGVPDMPVDLDRPDGDLPDGDVPDGDVPDGDVPDGDVPDGDVPDGDVPDAGTPDGSVPDGGACGLVGAPCPAAGCAAGQVCYERVCIPGSLGDCGGFAGLRCPAGLVCMVGGSASAWPCVTPAERDCVCAGPAAASFSGVCATPP